MFLLRHHESQQWSNAGVQIKCIPAANNCMNCEKSVKRFYRRQNYNRVSSKSISNRKISLRCDGKKNGMKIKRRWEKITGCRLFKNVNISFLIACFGQKRIREEVDDSLNRDQFVILFITNIQICRIDVVILS